MRKKDVTPWGERTPAERADLAWSLSERFSKTLSDPPKRAVWRTRTSTDAQILYDDPEDVARRFLWEAIRKVGGEPSGWAVELRRKGERVAVVVESEFGSGTEEVEAEELETDRLLCRAPDGNFVVPVRALSYHFVHAHEFTVGEGHFAIEEAKRVQARERAEAARRQVEESNRRAELRIREEREEARRTLAREVADGLITGALDDIDDALNDL